MASAKKIDRKNNHNSLISANSSSQIFINSRNKKHNTAYYVKNNLVNSQKNIKSNYIIDSYITKKNLSNQHKTTNNKNLSTTFNTKNNSNNKIFKKIENYDKNVIQKRPLSCRTNRANKVKNLINENNDNLNILNVILQTSQKPINMDLINQKFKSLNKEYSSSRILDNSTTRKFYAYNVIYGHKSNNIIKTYTPKLSQRIFSSHYQSINSNGGNIEQVFNEKQIMEIFREKCKDLNVPLKDELMSRFINFVKSKCVNRIIDLSECSLGLNSIQALSNIIYNNNDICSRIILNKNNLGDRSVELLVGYLENNTSIVELNLGSNSLSPKGGEIIFNFLITQKSIINLDLSSSEGIYRNRICPEGVKLIWPVLQNNLILEKIDLSSNSIRNEGFKYLINGLNYNFILHVLNISNNDIDEKGIEYMHNNLMECKLRDLNISFNPISNKGCILLGECTSNLKLGEINTLNLSNCNINFIALKHFLKNNLNNHKIQNLIMNKNNLSSDKWNTLEFLNRISLKSISLCECNISNSMQDISELFERHPTIKFLDFSHNQIDDNLFNYFADYPLHNLSLEEIDFSQNFITDESAVNFFKNLSLNKNIQKLNFFDNQLQTLSAKEIIKALLNNRNLISINLKCNRIPLKLLKEVKKQIQNNISIENRKFIPKLKGELKDLKFDPTEISKLKYKIINFGKDRIFLSNKYKEEDKNFNLRKKEDYKELNKILAKFENIQNEISETQKNIKKIEELSEFENEGFKIKQKKLDNLINNLENEIEILKKENQIAKNIQNEELKDIRDSYSNLLKMTNKTNVVFENNCSLLERKKVQYKLLNNKLDRLQHPEKFFNAEFKVKRDKKRKYKRSNSLRASGDNCNKDIRNNNHTNSAKYKKQK